MERDGRGGTHRYLCPLEGFTKLSSFSDDITPDWNIIRMFPISNWTKTNFSIGRSSIMCSPGVWTLTWIKTQMTPALN